MRRCIRGPVDVADRGRCRVAASGGAALSWHPGAGPAGGAGAACASARRAFAVILSAGTPGNPGLFNEMGKLFEKSLSIFPPLKSPQETIEDFNAQTKDAGDSLTRLAKPSSMVTGRMDARWRAMARRTARPALTSSVRPKASGRAEPRHRRGREMLRKSLLPGYKRAPGDCRTEIT